MLIILTGCSTMKASFTREGKIFQTGEEYYLAGDYISAVTLLSRALHIDPEYEDAKILLNESYSKSIRQLENLENELANSNRKFVNLEYLNLYIKVMEMYDEYNNIQGNYNKNYDYHEKVTIFREKAALDYYNAAVEESVLKDLESEKKCLEYLNMASDIWGEEYLDSYTIAAEYIYSKALRISEIRTRESYIKAADELQRVGEWIEGYKDSTELIVEFLEKSKSYFIVIGDEIISNKLQDDILDILNNNERKLSIYASDNSNAAKYQLENKPENQVETANEFNISNIVNVTINNIEYIDPYSEARFVVERKKFWIDELEQPLREVRNDTLEIWEEDEEYRIRLLENDGITGYKDFNYTYILNKIHSSINVTANITVYSVSSERVIGEESKKFSYVDTVSWVSEKKGNPDVFMQVMNEEINHRPVYTYDQLVEAVKKSVNLGVLSEKAAELIKEDNPLSKKID